MLCFQMVERDEQGRILRRMSDDEALQLARLRTAGRLVRGALHDIRNPIGAVGGNLEWLVGWHGDEQRRVREIEAALSPYAEPESLGAVVNRILGEGLADREEATEVFGECQTGLDMQLGTVLALGRVAQETSNVGRWSLATLVEESRSTALLFGKNIATWSVDVPDRMLEGDLSVWRLLLTSVLLDPLERFKARNLRGSIAVEQGLVVTDDAPQAPIPWSAQVAADRLGVRIDRDGGRTTLAL